MQLFSAKAIFENEIECFSDFQEKYLADPHSGACPFYNPLRTGKPMALVVRSVNSLGWECVTLEYF